MGYSPERKKRIPTHAEVKINNAYLAEALDISEDGMYIFSPHTYVPDSVVDIAVTINGDTTSFSGKIIHVQAGVGFGVSFPDIPDEVAGLFREILKDALKEQED
ncbi:MAG: PilZ domain-containing protein [Thermodesulfovibrionales bacterium]|nr:PilZ domain-containing protein [Thermodesulfovibrionales bacterium]